MNDFFNNFFKQILTIDTDYRALTRSAEGIEGIFENKDLTYDMVMSFIDKFKDEIIASALGDEAFYDNILAERHFVDRTKKDTINKEYLEDLIEQIKNKDFNPKSLTFYFYIINIHNLCALKYDDDSIREILNNNMITIIQNSNISSIDNKLRTIDDKKEQMDKLLSWNRRCGNAILSQIFLIEALKDNAITLLSSDELSNNTGYQQKLCEIIKTCDLAIEVRDSDYIPSEDEVFKINGIFKEYDYINKSITLGKIDEGDVLLIHFVREKDVNYQLVGDVIKNLAVSSNNGFDDDQSSFFVESYLKHIIVEYETTTGKQFDINNPEVREFVTKKLEHFNDVMNNRPLERLPIKKQEVGHDLRTYIREPDSRISCSLISKDNPCSHLDRNIGLLLRPKKPTSIMSISAGYTSEKSFYDFKNDSYPSTEVIDGLQDRKSVNEICMKADECEVVGVLVLTDDELTMQKAARLAQLYNVDIVKLERKKETVENMY